MLSITTLIRFSKAMLSICRISGWMVGSPPLNWTTSGVALELDEAVQHALDLLQREAESGLSVGETYGTVQCSPVAVDARSVPGHVCCLCSGQSSRSPWGSRRLLQC